MCGGIGLYSHEPRVSRPSTRGCLQISIFASRPSLSVSPGRTFLRPSLNERKTHNVAACSAPLIKICVIVRESIMWPLPPVPANVHVQFSNVNKEARGTGLHTSGFLHAHSKRGNHRRELVLVSLKLSFILGGSSFDGPVPRPPLRVVPCPSGGKHLKDDGSKLGHCG